MPRIREADLVVPTLQILAARPNGFATTSDLIIELDNYFQPDGLGAAQLEGRRDSYFSQKVRNLVSHRGSSTSMETRGWATYDQVKEGWNITDAGRRFLGQMNELNL